MLVYIHKYTYIHTYTHTRTHTEKKPDSSVSIVTRLRAGQGFNSRQGYAFFSSPPSPEWLWGPRLSHGYRGLLATEVKKPEREVDHSLPSSGPAPPPSSLHARCLIKQEIRLHGVTLKHFTIILHTDNLD